MVFLGGAVLANIVSFFSLESRLLLMGLLDGGQGEYVGIETGMGGARSAFSGKAGSQINYPLKCVLGVREIIFPKCSRKYQHSAKSYMLDLKSPFISC